MILHPVIQKFSNLILEGELNNLFDNKILKRLQDAGASATEATMVLHLGYKMDIKEVEEFVFNSGIFPEAEINDVAFESYEYLYYDRYNNNQ